MGKQGKLIWIVCAAVFMCGCDPLTTHKIATTIFDGVPSLPEPEQYCDEYHQKKLADEREAAKQTEKSATANSGSIHPPYAEKSCDKCHDQSKGTGLIRPRQELCFICHPNIIKGSFTHGPAAVGGCLECHDPHSSNYPSLLKVSKGTLCAGCHREKRAAAGLHDKVTARGMLCMDCHDPHSGNAQYFLR